MYCHIQPVNRYRRMGKDLGTWRSAPTSWQRVIPPFAANASLVCDWFISDFETSPVCFQNAPSLLHLRADEIDKWLPGIESQRKTPLLNRERQPHPTLIPQIPKSPQYRTDSSFQNHMPRITARTTSCPQLLGDFWHTAQTGEVTSYN